MKTLQKTLRRCWKNKIPLKYYGRLDEGIAVNINILNGFLKNRSSNYICKLVQHHHAKVIWWRGVGMYIGSANLTNHAWYKNVEAGCFFEETEIDDVMERGILKLFDTLDANSTPLTEELVNEMQKRSNVMFFWKNGMQHYKNYVISGSKSVKLRIGHHG